MYVCVSFPALLITAYGIFRINSCIVRPGKVKFFVSHQLHVSKLCRLKLIIYIPRPLIRTYLFFLLVSQPPISTIIKITKIAKKTKNIV